MAARPFCETRALGRAAPSLGGPGHEFRYISVKGPLRAHAATIAIHMTVSVQTRASPKPMLEARLK